MSDTRTGRLNSIDVARALGLLLVYYGHFVEQVMYLKNPAAAIHYKWIYSFHMILFFVLSGWIRGARPGALPAGKFARATLAGRIVPYLFFSLVTATLSLAVPGWFPVLDLAGAEGYFQAALATAMGFPIFNIPLWFVACLVGVECLHRLLHGWLDTNLRIVVAAMVCYVGGYALNEQYFFLGQGRSFWLLHEVPVVYAFYLVGVLFGRTGRVERLSVGTAAAVALVSLALVQFSFDLNQGPFRYLQAVVILLSGHGHFLWFPFTALAGTALVVALGRILENVALLSFFGRNALIMLGMNGVFYHFVNAPVAAWSAAHLPGGGWSVFAMGALVTAASFTICVPVIHALNALMPQLVGKPREAGRFFGPLLRD